MGLAKYNQLMSAWFSKKKATRNASPSRSSLPLNAPSSPLLAISLPPTPAMISDDYVPLARTASMASIGVVTTSSPALVTETEVVSSNSFDMTALGKHLPINANFATPSKSSDGECLSSQFSASPVSYCASRSSLGSPASCISSTSISSYDSLDLDRRYPYKPAHLANWQWKKRSEEINIKLANKLQVTAEPLTELDSVDEGQRTAVNYDRAKARNNAFGSLYEATNFKSTQTASALPESTYLSNQQDRTSVNRTELAHRIEMYKTLKNYATRKVGQYMEELRTLDQIKEEKEENDEGNSEQDEDGDEEWNSFMRML